MHTNGRNDNKYTVIKTIFYSSSNFYQSQSNEIISKELKIQTETKTPRIEKYKKHETGEIAQLAGSACLEGMRPWVQYPSMVHTGHDGACYNLSMPELEGK